MFCGNCGKEIEDARICPFCGEQIVATEESSGFVKAPDLNQSAEKGTPHKADKQNRARKKKGGSGIKKVLIAVAAIVAGLVAVVAILLAASCGAITLYQVLFGENGLFGKKEPLVLSELECSNIYLVADTKNEVTFTVKANQALESVSLYDEYNVATPMYDNGTNGDAEANDGIYSCKLVLKKNCQETKSAQYQCRMEEVQSNIVKVYYFPQPTEESALEAMEDYEELSENILSLEQAFADNNGIVPDDSYSDLFDAITDELDMSRDAGVVLHYEREDNSLYVKMTSGLSMVYAPRTADTDSIGSDVTATIVTLQPCFTQMGGSEFGTTYTGYALPENVDYILEMLDVSGQNLRNTLPNFKFQNSNNCDDEAVTLEKIRSIGANQVVLWHGHGYYGPIVKSCLVTGEPFDWYAWRFDAEYFSDCVDNRIVNSLLLGYDEVIISSGYIEKYCGDMTDSFIYLAACDSGRHPGLAESFTSKGAVVVANTKTIMRTYNVAMLYGTVNEMIKINPNTGKFYTLSEALTNAKATYGNDDSDSRYGGIGSTPIIFGDDKANDYRFAEEVPTGNISGKVCKAFDRITPIDNASIEVYIDGVLFKETTSDGEGLYELELPIGNCEIKISAAGYISYSCYSNIRAGSTSYMETFLMVEGDPSQYGIASGKIINSLSGQGVGNTSLTIYKDWNAMGTGAAAVATTSSDGEGDYSVELPYGNYTVEVEKEGFTRSSFNIIVQGGITDNQDGTITPEINGNDYLITLTWDANPRDLDSHVQGSTTSGSGFHVYYADKTHYDYTQGESVCNLDYDDTQSYGPEHITLAAIGTKPYYYYVHKYAGTGTLASSGAKVTIEQNNIVLAEFHVPPGLSTGDYWNVFAIVDGEIVVNNTITYAPNINYATTD